MSTKVFPAATAVCKCALHNSTLKKVEASCHIQTIGSKVALAQVLLCALRLYTVSITQAMLHTPFIHPSIHPFICYRVYIILKKSQHRWTKHFTTLAVLTLHKQAHTHIHVRWFKYDRDICGLFTQKSVPVIFEPHCTYIHTHIQGDSGGICTTLGNDSMSDSKQKSSYEQGSDFERLRSYDRLKLGIEGNDYWQWTEENNKPA